MNTPITEKNTVAFRLSLEELLYLLSALNLKTIPDLGGKPFGDIPAKQKDQILMAGFNGLRAKGWVQLPEDEGEPIVVDKLFASTLVVCATSNKMLSIETISRSKPSLQVYFYHSPNMFVVHRLIDSGLHEFVITSEQAEAITMFERMVNINPPGQLSTLSGFSVSNKEATGLMQSIQDHDLSVIQKTLQDANVEDDSAKAFLICLESLAHVVNLTLIDFPKNMKTVDDLSASTVSVLSAAESSWIIENEGEGGVHCSPLQPDSLDSWLHFFEMSGL